MDGATPRVVASAAMWIRLLALGAIACAPVKLTPEQYYGGAAPEDSHQADATPDAAADASEAEVVATDTISSDLEETEAPADAPQPEDLWDDASDTGAPDVSVPDVSDPIDATDLAEPGDVEDVPDEGPCFVDCAGKQCGDDGCGGTCGECAAGFACSKSQACIPACTPQCFKKQCGPDQCGGACGICPGDFECGADGKCYDALCTPNCDGKVCGDDGCEGSCGDCAPGDLCEAGQCVVGPCSGVPFDTGKCQDDKALQCLGGKHLVVKDCPGQDLTCGWNPVMVAYDCIPKGQCFPQCLAQECGDDGCGGFCGVCPPSWPCANGSCIATQGGGCGYYTVVGTCAQDLLWWCEGGVLQKRDCAAEGKSCGFNPDQLLNQCLD